MQKLRNLNRNYNKIVFVTFENINIQNRVACPKFGHSALNSDLYNYALNAQFVAAVGMLRKI